MSAIVDPRIETYLEALYDDGDPVRHAMEELARERGFPIVGPLVGRTLAVLTHAIGARRVFELGSGYGYSALHFARAVGSGGIVHCTDLSPDNLRIAERFFTQAGLRERVVYHLDDGRRTLMQAGGTWDIIFNDIEKPDYPSTIELAYAHLRPGGLFITDNVLWSGRVLGPKPVEPATVGVLEFTRRLLAHPGFVTTIDPTRDGLAVGVRLRQDPSDEPSDRRP
jgi:caffeoyl-CoA O-methyltransferase